MGCNAETMEQLEEDKPVLLLHDTDDLDLENLGERLVFEMRRGIGHVDSCEWCGMLLDV